jgi:RNA polymerase sigma-70 factor (ECF subfamily)
MGVDDARQRGSETISSSLLDGVRSLRADSWRRMVHIYGPLVYRWCVQAGVSRDDAEDLGQEVFRTVSTRIDSFRREKTGDTFGGWLRIITRHKVADFWRRTARQPHTVGTPDLLEGLSEPMAPSIPSEPEDEREEIRSVVHARALELIQSEFKESSWKAFLGTAVDGRLTADVASDLGMTTMAVRKAKSRVLRRLREEFEELGDFDYD